MSLTRARWPAVVVGWAVALSTCSSPAEDPRVEAGPGTQPNVLIIVTDDQRADTLGVMPATRDWLARGGRTFTNAFATTPVCCPSRASILTGRYAHNHGVVNNVSAPRIDDNRTLQEALRSRGFRTAIVGKFLNRWDLEGGGPAGFDRWAVFNQGYRGAPFNLDGQHRVIREYTTDFVADASVDILEGFERGDHRPWFLYVAPFAPHPPARPAPRDRDAPTPSWTPSPAVGEEDRTDKPPVVQSHRTPEDSAARMRGLQLRSLMAVDRLVARVRRTLSSLGEERRTLVIFVSDNGYFWAEHGLHDKRLPYLEASRIPLLVRWPGRVEPGTTDPRLAANVDIAATVLDAVGGSGPEIDGRSLLDASARDRVLLEYWPDDPSDRIPQWAALTSESRQYIEYYDANGDVSFREYYDLAADPWQLTNLLRDRDPTNDPPEDELAELSRRLALDRRCRGTTGDAACP